MENTKQAKPEVGTVYADGDGQFYEAVKVTSKTVTLRPIAAHRARPGNGGPYMYSTPLLPCLGGGWARSCAKWAHLMREES